MAEVPEDERAGVVGDAGQRCGIREESGAVRHVAQQHHRRLGPTASRSASGEHAGRPVHLDPPHAPAPLRRDALDQEAVGGEVVAIHDDLDPGGPRRALRVEGRPQELVEQDRGGVADDGLARRRPDHRAPDRVADGERQRHPRLVPPADQPAAPFVADERLQARGGAPGRPAERVAVEVDQRVSEPTNSSRSERADRPHRGRMPRPRGRRERRRCRCGAVNRGHRGSAPRWGGPSRRRARREWRRRRRAARPGRRSRRRASARRRARGR